MHMGILILCDRLEGVRRTRTFVQPSCSIPLPERCGQTTSATKHILRDVLARALPLRSDAHIAL
eukprot:3155881-Pyramimonas_sp.AAC.1